ncbi:hypothetical protein LTS18_011734, partial [Coniosporium uncinatum]
HPSGIKGDFAQVKSINQMDKAQAQAQGNPSSGEFANAVAEVDRTFDLQIVKLHKDGTRLPFRSVKELEKEVLAYRLRG